MRCTLEDVAFCFVAASPGSSGLGGVAAVLGIINEPQSRGEILLRTETATEFGGYAAVNTIINQIDGGCPGSLIFEGSVAPVDPASPDAVIRKALLINGQWLFALAGKYGFRSETLVIDPVTGEFDVPGGVPFVPGDSISLFQIEFDDTTFDVNADGRFNQADVDGMLAFIGSLNEADLGRFDQDMDGVITPADIARFQSMIDAGMGSGVFGDADADGFVT